jgi:bifunctional UDP-N-acetylglucosamine pyrophosphorylase / glucosamine-1-phosphate N-acetyltransferase
MKQLNVVILAAGKGERMMSGKPKVMHEVMGKPMIGHVVEQARGLSPSSIVVVVGFGREKVQEYLKAYDVKCSVQSEQKGTAHALLSAEKFLDGGDVVVLYGDVPLIEAATLQDFISFSIGSGSIAFLTTHVDNPAGYGRVMMKGDEISDIIEDADATPEEKKVREINTGIFIIPEARFPLLRMIENNNKKGEFYLTDICKVARSQGLPVKGFHYHKSTEVLGINGRRELLDANLTMRDRNLETHMQKGVTMLGRDICIDSGVTIGKDTTIFPNCYIIGETTVGENVSIGPNTIIKNSRIDNDVQIEGFTVMEGAQVGEGANIGPFSRIRPRTVLEKKVKIGNFVEVKNSTLRSGTKANHLSYIGDADIGSGVNIGAGTITCNYDGKLKHKTVIEDNVFVGSNTEIVAPVTIGKDAVIGAGTTVTRNVPEGALAVSRTQQKHVDGYGKRKKS